MGGGPRLQSCFVFTSRGLSVGGSGKPFVDLGLRSDGVKTAVGHYAPL